MTKTKPPTKSKAAATPPPLPDPAAARQIKTIADLSPDQRNANRGTERGSALIENSLRKYGAGRSILADKNGKIIGGNKTLEAAGSIGLERIRVIQTDGHELVVVQRTDLDLDSDRAARELAIVDNRAGQLSLEFDADELLRTAGDFDIDLGAVGFAEAEVAELADGRAMGGKQQDAGRNLNASKKQAVVKVVIAVAELSAIEDALRKTGQMNRGDAFLEICKSYLSGSQPTKGQLDVPLQA